MGDWIEWSTVWKAGLFAASAFPVLRSWRKHWEGPRGFKELVYTQWRLNKALWDMTISRDDWEASDGRQRERAELYKAGYYELMKEIREIKEAALAASIDLKQRSAASFTDPVVLPTIEVHSRSSKKLPVSTRVSHKRNAMRRSPRSSSPNADGTQTGGPTTPGRRSSGADPKKGTGHD